MCKLVVRSFGGLAIMIGLFVAMQGSSKARTIQFSDTSSLPPQLDTTSTRSPPSTTRWISPKRTA